jgi:hypothetical protein
VALRAVASVVVAALILSACSGGDDGGDASDATPTTAASETTLPATTTTAEPAGFDLAWKVPIDGNNDDLLVGSHIFVLDGGRVRAFDLDSGALTWSAEVGVEAPLSATPVDDDLVVSASNGGGDVVRLDGATGAEEWRTDTQSINPAVVVVDDDGPPVGVVISSFAAGFRRLDLATGALSDEVRGAPRAISASRVVTIEGDGIVTFTDLATMQPVAPPLDTGITYSFDAVDVASGALLMVNTQELALMDPTGTILARGRVGAPPIVSVRAIGDDRVLVFGLGGAELHVRDGDRYDEVWRDDGFAYPEIDGEQAYVIGVNGSIITVVDASAEEPAPVGSIDLGDNDPRSADARVRNRLLFVNRGGLYSAHALDDGMAEVWTIPLAQGDLIRPYDDGVVALRLDFLAGQLVLERYS